MSLYCIVCSDILTIPQDAVISTRNQVISTKCGHLFHNLCIRKWLLKSENKLKCPKCKSHLEVNEFTRIHELKEFAHSAENNTISNSMSSSSSDKGKNPSVHDASALLKKLSLNITKGEELLEQADDLLVEMIDLLLDNNNSGNAESVESADNKIEDLTETLGGLKINDRVVWMGSGDFKDDECDFGYVRWLGKLGDAVVAGVEFDDPTGNNNGEMNGRQYFPCEPNHGRFLYVKELMLYNDLFNIE